MRFPIPKYPSPNRLFPLFAAALTLSIGHRAAASEWPAARRDSAHSAAAPGTLPAGTPSIVWRAYLGGRPTGEKARFGLPSPHIAVAFKAGRLIAKDVNTQATLWQSPPIGPGLIADIADLQGNGNHQIVAYTDENAWIIDSNTGDILWQSPQGAFGRIGEVRVTDLNGDQIQDVYIDDGSGGKTGLYSSAAYSFSSGFASPISLWNRPYSTDPPSVNAGTDALFDLNADGIPEIVLCAYKEALVIRGDTGAPITLLNLPNTIGNPFSQGTALAADLHPNPGKELIVVQGEGQVVNQGGPPALMVYSFNPLISGPAQFLYQKSSQHYEAEIVQSAEMVADFDGDGQSELVFSQRSPLTGMAWLTEILNGSSGNTLATYTGARFEGAADLNGLPGDELVLADAQGLSVYAWQNGAFSPITQPLPGLRALTTGDSEAKKHAPIDRKMAVIQRPGEPAELLLGQPAHGGEYSELNTLQSFSNAINMHLDASSPNGWAQGQTYTPAVGIITDVMPAPYSTRPYPQMAMGTSFGTLEILDSDMMLTNGDVAVDQLPLGTRIGGTFLPREAISEGPRITRDSESPLVVLPGSPKGLNVANAKNASLVVEPQTRWIAPNMNMASAMPAPPGQIDPWIVGMEGSLLTARASATGNVLRQIDLGDGRAAAPPMLLHQNGVPGPVVGVDLRTPGVQIIQWAVDLGSNTVLSTSDPIAFGGYYASAAGDIDGDGNDEWYWVRDILHRRSISSPNISDFPGVKTGYANPVIAQFSGSSAPDILLSGSIQGPVLVDNSMNKAWEAPLPEAMNVMAGTRIECSGNPRFITPALQSPVLRSYDGSAGTLISERVLAGGQVFASMAQAQAAGKTTGMLSNANSIVSVLPDGTPAVLTGSTDGFLYALDGCSMNLLWAKNMDAPVAEPIIGDTDGDGLDEIVVSAADGYVYGLDFPLLIPPIELAIEGADKQGNKTLQVGEKALLKWKFPPGTPTGAAVELSLADPEGRPMWEPAYRIFQTESAEISMEGALAQRPYRVMLRTAAGDQVSAETMSGALLIDDKNAPKISVRGFLGDKPAQVRLELSAEDDLSLSHYLIQLSDPDSGYTRVEDDAPAHGKSIQASHSFKISKEFFGKTIELTCGAIDSGNNTSTAILKAKLDELGNIQFIRSEASSEPQAEPPGKQVIGGCSAAPEPVGADIKNPRSQAQWLLLSAALLAVSRARKRS